MVQEVQWLSHTGVVEKLGVSLPMRLDLSQKLQAGLEGWRVPGGSLVFSSCWKLEYPGSHIPEGIQQPKDR